MRLDTKRNDITAGGMLDQRNFTIKAGAHIMAVLSGLYKNPVDAMVREYLTNMYDAYVALRRMNPGAAIHPPTLHLPTTLDGSLVFRDNGIGMSKDTVWNVYSQYGNSTKNDDNLEVGGFGLGSKTAFCYNGGQSWTIESRFDGEKHTFMAFVGEDGVPNLTHVSTSPTIEHNGVTIKIPIRREDHRNVYAAASRYVPYFPMELVVEGDREIAPVSYTVRTETWGILTRTNYSYGVRAQVIMGNVPYAIDWNEVKIPTYGNKFDPYYLHQFLTANPVDLYVPVGAVDIVPSRDDMKYTDKTKATIHKALKALIDGLADQINQKLDSCTSEWDALITYEKMNDMQHLKSIVKSLTYRGNNIDPAVGIVRKVSALNKLDKDIQVSVYGTDPSNGYGDTTNRAAIVERDSTNLSMRTNGRTWIVIDDLPKGGILMTRSLLYEKLVNRSGTRAARYGHKIGHAILLKTSLSKKQLSDFFGGVPEDLIKTTAELKGIVTIPTALRARKDTIYRWSGSSWEARVNAPAEAGKTYYYLPMTVDTSSGRYRYLGMDGRMGIYYARECVRRVTELAQKIGLIDHATVIYGVKATDVGNFDSSIWLNLEDAVIDEALKLIPTCAEALAYQEIMVSQETNSLVVALTESSLATKTKSRLAADPLFDDFIQAIQKIEKMKNHPQSNVVTTVSQNNSKVMQVLQDTIKQVKVVDYASMEKNIRSKYPLIDIVAEMIRSSGYYSSNSIGIIRRSHSKDSLLDYVTKRR